MTDKELMDLVRAVAFSPSPVKSSPAWQALKAHCTQPTDVQQLKAEIDALAERIESSARVGDVMQPLEIFRELRQLSAV